jgi:hypothetical protein
MEGVGCRAFRNWLTWAVQCKVVQLTIPGEEAPDIPSNKHICGELTSQLEICAGVAVLQGEYQDEFQGDLDTHLA